MPSRVPCHPSSERGGTGGTRLARLPLAPLGTAVALALSGTAESTVGGWWSRGGCPGCPRTSVLSPYFSTGTYSSDLYAVPESWDSWDTTLVDSGASTNCSLNPRWASGNASQSGAKVEPRSRGIVGPARLSNGTVQSTTSARAARRSGPTIGCSYARTRGHRSFPRRWSP